MSVDGSSWFLMNASPDIHRQIENFPALHPRGVRHSPIAGIFLSNGDLDHCLGLFSLRESQPLTLYATASVRRNLMEHNVIVRTLTRFSNQLSWQTLEPGHAITVGEGLEVTAHPVPGKLPLHLNGLAPPSAENNVGFWMRDGADGRIVAYAPNVGSVDPEFIKRLNTAECIFFDGTFWSEDELEKLGSTIPGPSGHQRSQDMAHIPVGGPSGSLSRLQNVTARRKIYTHLNNTNPLLNEDSPEYRTASSAGWEIATDGLEINL